MYRSHNISIQSANDSANDSAIDSSSDDCSQQDTHDRCDRLSCFIMQQSRLKPRSSLSQANGEPYLLAHPKSDDK